MLTPDEIEATLNNNYCWKHELFIKRGKSPSGKQRYLLATGHCSTGNSNGRPPARVLCQRCGTYSAKKNGKFKRNPDKQKYLCTNPYCGYAWVYTENY